MNRAQQVRLFLLRWHRRLGVAAAVLVIFLAFTGILLNHTDDLRLDESHLSHPWLLSHYGVGPLQIRSFVLPGQEPALHISQVDGSALFLSGQGTSAVLPACEGALLGAVKHGRYYLVLCEYALLQLDEQGQLGERLTAMHGLPAGLQAIAVQDGQLLLHTRGRVVQPDLLQLQWRPTDIVADAVAWSGPSEVSAADRRALQGRLLGKDLNAERLLLDLHSGRFWGQAGVIIMDLAAIAMMLLALSGVWVWARAKWRRSRA